MILYEIKKQLKKPFVWIFLGLCLALDIAAALADKYDTLTVMNVNNIAVSLGTARMGEEYAAYCCDTYGEELCYGDFADPNSAEAITRDLTAPYSNRRVYPALLKYEGTDARLRLNEFFTEAAYPALQKRIAEINENKEHLWLNGGHTLHELIYRPMWLISWEAGVFALLISIRLGSLEHTEGTAESVYSAKKGRGLFVAKLLAGVILTAMLLTAVLIVSYAVFFIKCPCFALLGSAALIPDSIFFVIPWANFTVWEFFLLNAAFCFVTSILLTVFGYCVFGIVRNVYIASAGAVILSVGTFLLSLVVPSAPAPRLFILSTPVMLIMSRPGNWFSLSCLSVPIPWFECIAAAVWAVILTAGAFFITKRLRRAGI